MKAVIEQLLFHKMFLDILTRKLRKNVQIQPLRYPGTALISTGLAAQIAEKSYVVISN